jgi:hypothetical protein
VHRDEELPLLRRDLPELEWVLPGGKDVPMASLRKTTGLRRRDFGFGALAFGTFALLMPRSSGAQAILESLKGDVSRLKNAIAGDIKALKEDVREKVAYILGLESYVYGYPMVVMDVTREVLTAAPAPNSEGTAAPINQLAKMPHYVSLYFTKVVRISLNSLWTTGWLDLDKEPIVVSVPDTRDRYYVFSVMNMWTDVFGSIGKRTTGTAPGNFLIAGPEWQGTAPTNIKETYRSSTRYAWLLGQTQANGPDDFAAVNAIQAGYKLTPLNAWGKPYTSPAKVPVDNKVNILKTPPNQVAAMDAETFFRRLALAMKDNPPYPADGPALEKLKKLGVEPGKDFAIGKIDPAIARGLQRAVKEAPTKLAEGTIKMKNVNGWIRPADLGRYGTDYDTRAGIAMAGLGADLQEDTIYPIAFVDGDGKRLDSANKYVLRFDKGRLPPTNATWSVSLYQGPNYVPNDLDRYDIAPWMPLDYGAGGSLDIYIQAASPGKDKEANWLPTPASGEFNIVIRNYWPKQEALDGTYKNPPIKKIS